MSSAGVQDLSSASYLRSPLPLSAAQEAQVKDIYYKRVKGHCAQEIREFAECAVGRTISATWVCRDQRLSMNSCMIAHATRAEEDAARAEWFSSREERRKKREAEADAMERRREEVIELTRKEKEKERAAKKNALTVSSTTENSKDWW